jgi:hypothetical protein
MSAIAEPAPIARAAPDCFVLDNRVDPRVSRAVAAAPVFAPCSIARACADPFGVVGAG